MDSSDSRVNESRNVVTLSANAFFVFKTAIRAKTTKDMLLRSNCHSGNHTCICMVKGLRAHHFSCTTKGRKQKNNTSGHKSILIF